MKNKEYAGFWIRVGASLIDILIMMIVLGTPLYLIYGVSNDPFVIRGFWDFFLGYIVPIVATIWFWLRFSATPGKMATKLTIVDAKTGGELSLTQAIVRYLAYIPAALPFGLGFIWVGVDKKKQGWHDKLAGTVVIKTNDIEKVKFEDSPSE